MTQHPMTSPQMGCNDDSGPLHSHAQRLCPPCCRTRTLSTVYSRPFNRPKTKIATENWFTISLQVSVDTTTGMTSYGVCAAGMVVMAAAS